MKKNSRVIGFVFCLLLSHTAIAQSTAPYYQIDRGDDVIRQVPLENSQVKMIGRGFQMKKSGQFLGLSCLTEDCKQLQFIYLSTQQQLFHIGPIYRLVETSASTAISGPAITQLQKKLLKEVLIDSVDRRSSALGGILFFAAGATTSALLISTSSAPILIFLGAMGVITLTGESGSIFKAFDWVGGIRNNWFKTSQETRMFLDQGGWNWSVKPQKVNFDRFCNIQHAIFGHAACYNN